MLFNKIPTLEEFEVAQHYDFLKKKEADKLKAIENNSLVEWEKYYQITNRWASAKQTINGDYVWEICQESDGVYETIEYSSDLFPEEE